MIAWSSNQPTFRAVTEYALSPNDLDSRSRTPPPELLGGCLRLSHCASTMNLTVCERQCSLFACLENLKANVESFVLPVHSSVLLFGSFNPRRKSIMELQSVVLPLRWAFNILLNISALPVLVVQGALLHPYYESDPQFRKMRAWLAPVIIFLALYSQSRRLFQPLELYLHLNYAGIAIPTFHVICLALQYAFHRGPARKIDLAKHKKEESPVSESESDSSSSITNSDSQATSTVKATQPLQTPTKKVHKSKKSVQISDKKAPPIGELARFSICMTFSPRSLNYVWGPPPSILSPAPKISTIWFLFNQLFNLIVHQFLLVAFCSFTLPATAHPQGTFGWIAQWVSLPDHYVTRLACHKVLLAAWGCVGLSAFETGGALLNLWELFWIQLGRLIFRPSNSWRPDPFDTSAYPPLFKTPLFQESLSDFWGKGWQSVFRRDFIFLGAEPMVKVFAPFGQTASRLAGLMGAMFISGIMVILPISFSLINSDSLVSTVKNIDWYFRTTWFFMAMGLGIVIEVIFRRVTGKRVQGVFGWLWLWFWFGLWIDMIMNVWLERGLGTSGMSGSLAVTQWPLAKFLIPLGPLMPDAIISSLSSCFSYTASQL
ncbi:hypothetical protein O181_060665 [Austropuccinia psidii MF-1]|uniref:Wax synthase domain-containing protein n=1 Tax=Austropuccinia psidii MF-1 TaxID=1389203 RepID=A0A9Q3EDQ1_9BASI|nr:hypothetical protein [Austropuccinia psidii MF-1]